MLLQPAPSRPAWGLHSPLLRAAGVRHAFGTRLDGGIQEDLRLAVALGLPVDRVARVHQVHGAVVHRPDGRKDRRQGHRPDRRQAQAGPWPRADALVSDRPGLGLAVFSADCIPLLLARDDGSAVAAVHAGWRGLLAGVIGAALAELCAPGSSTLAALGPCVCADHFEVGPELAQAFDEAGHGAQVRPGRDDRSHVDLPGVARAQLLALGLTAIDRSPHCTWERPDLFSSHRRDVTRGGAPRTGRQISFIAAGPA